MSPFIVLIVVLLAALLVCFLLWRRESRAAGAPLSITGLAIPLLVVAVAGLGYLTIGLDRNTLDWLADQRRYDPVAERVIAGRQFARKVEEALAEFPDRAVKIFRRSRIDGIAQRAIAEEFGVSISTVEGELRAIYRVLAELRERLDEE